MLNRQDILRWLRTDDDAGLEELWRLADETRKQCVGDAVHLRGLIELSNNCERSCLYCGLREPNDALPRYRMSDDEVLQCAQLAAQLGYGTVVMQAGQDPGLTGPWVTDVIQRIKRETNLAVTLSLGERTSDELALWRQAGADRYLLRFETSNQSLYRLIHPQLGRQPSDRIAILRLLRELGYEIGSGVMIGIPGQTHEDLANDIELFASLDLDMIGVGPFIAHPDTPLGQLQSRGGGTKPDQAPATELMAYKVIALARLACPNANIPSTTALATLNRTEGRELGLMRGANVVMPSLTPAQYRVMYEIYPGKACINETAQQCCSRLNQRIASIGRTVGVGRGDSPRMTKRRADAPIDVKD